MISAEQSRAARGLLNWSQSELAARSNLGESTIRNFEAGRRVPAINNLAAIRRAFEAAGVVTIGDDESSPSGGAGVRLASRASQ